MSNALATLSLEKGQKTSLSKASPGLNRIQIGLGSKPAAKAGEQFDLDVVAYLLTADNKLTSTDRMIWYKNEMTPSDAVFKTPDNLTGEGDGDDETIFINWSQLPVDVKQVAIFCNIYDAKNRNQSFGRVNDAYIRIMNAETGEEIKRYELNEKASDETGFLMGKVYDSDGEIKFEAGGFPNNASITEIAQQFQ